MKRKKRTPRSEGKRRKVLRQKLGPDYEAPSPLELDSDQVIRSIVTGTKPMNLRVSGKTTAAQRRKDEGGS